MMSIIMDKDLRVPTPKIPYFQQFTYLLFYVPLLIIQFVNGNDRVTAFYVYNTTDQKEIKTRVSGSFREV